VKQILLIAHAKQNVKQSLYRSGQALKAAGCWGSKNF